MGEYSFHSTKWDENFGGISCINCSNDSYHNQKMCDILSKLKHDDLTKTYLHDRKVPIKWSEIYCSIMAYKDRPLKKHFRHSFVLHRGVFINKARETIIKNFCGDLWIPEYHNTMEDYKENMNRCLSKITVQDSYPTAQINGKYSLVAVLLLMIRSNKHNIYEMMVRPIFLKYSCLGFLALHLHRYVVWDVLLKGLYL